ncbi:MAG: YdcF family protein [Candidatus Rifleibacteriota bacterium]
MTLNGDDDFSRNNEMNFLFKSIVLFFPAVFLILIPQAPDKLEDILAIAFISASILMLAGCRSSSDKIRAAACCFRNGLTIALFFMIICAFFPIGGYIAEPLYLEHSKENADAIFVMASGATKAADPGLSCYQRVLHGIELFKAGRAPRLIVSTGFNPRNNQAESLWVASITSLCSIPSEQLDILVNPRITTSKTEADFALEHFNQHKIRRILLVTSGSHVFRSKKVFEKIGIEVLPAPCHSIKSLYHSMGHNLISFNSALHEWIGLIYYRLRNFI